MTDGPTPSGRSKKSERVVEIDAQTVIRGMFEDQKLSDWQIRLVNSVANQVAWSFYGSDGRAVATANDEGQTSAPLTAEEGIKAHSVAIEIVRLVEGMQQEQFVAQMSRAELNQMLTNIDPGLSMAEPESSQPKTE